MSFREPSALKKGDDNYSLLKASTRMAGVEADIHDLYLHTPGLRG